MYTKQLSVTKMRLVLLSVSLFSCPLSTSAIEGCSFKNGECTYNIQLAPPSGNCMFQGLQTQEKHTVMDTQNDYAAKMDSMEKSLEHVKEQHEKRLKELENSVRELLGLDKRQYGSNAGKETESSKRFSIFEDDLLKQLQDEFEKIRLQVKEKTGQLLDTEIKLNETKKMMKESQKNVLSVNHQLMDAEHKIALLKRERAILKNQLKDKTYKLNRSVVSLNESEAKITTMEQQMFRLIRSENNLKEELQTCQLVLNETEEQLVTEKKLHDELRHKHRNVRHELRIREHELIDCYSAKTQTFCGFEDPDVCGFQQENDTDLFDWIRVKGTTPSESTGPSTGDHTCGGPTGHFMFIEASTKGRGNNAVMYSPLYRGLKQQCIQFYYHMHGRDIGTLNVYAKARGATLTSVWRAYGNQGDVWSEARLGIPKELARAGYQIAFEGITENGYQGDISIDDVIVRDGECPVDTSITPVVVSVNSTALLKASKAFAKKIRRRRLRRNH